MIYTSTVSGHQPKPTFARSLYYSASTRADTVEVVDADPPPAVVVDAHGQLHAESGIITYDGAGLDGELWRWLS